MFAQPTTSKKHDFIDRNLWPATSEIATSNYSPRFWRFSESSTPATFKLLFVQNGRQILSREISIRYGCIFALLDLCYRNSCSLVENDIKNAKRLMHYLKQLCSAVQEEIWFEDPRTLKQDTWRSITVKEWAIRTHRTVGHSLKGRKTYEDQCKQENKIAYDEDPTMYGE
jgi:hypothetical protein